MSGKLVGRVALITGAARGQGRAHAVRLAREGADIIAMDIAAPIPGVYYDPATEEDLAETVRLVESLDRRIVAEVGDVRDLNALRTLTARGVSELGRLDVVVANAGICIPSAWDKISPETFRDVMDINVTGVWNTVMATAPDIIAGGRGGSIILTSSYAGVKMQPFMVHYTTSKHAVTGMARAFAAELGQHNIRVNSIHPGPVNTPMGSGTMREHMAEAGESYPVLNGMGNPFLQQWSAEPEQIADAVCWLASDESSFVSATRLSIDGGMAQF